MKDIFSGMWIKCALGLNVMRTTKTNARWTKLFAIIDQAEELVGLFSVATIQLSVPSRLDGGFGFGSDP